MECYNVNMIKAAIVYDFDKTLCTKDMQEYSLIPELGYNNPNSVKYKSTDYRDIKLEDAQYADVYIYHRR